MRSDSVSPLGGNRANRQAHVTGSWLSHFSRPQRAPTVVLNPATDTEFEAHVKSLLPNMTSPESLEEALHEQYPRVVVHRRELSSEPMTIWYVYRDGRWRP